MLNELAKKDKLWREMAYKLCSNRMLADDIVQDMYLKVKDYKDVNEFFIYKVLKNLFLNHIKEKKTISINDFHYLECTNKIYEPDDYERQLIDAFFVEEWHRQEFILEGYDRSLREIERIYRINYAFVYREAKIAKENIIKKVNGNTD